MPVRPLHERDNQKYVPGGIGSVWSVEPWRKKVSRQSNKVKAAEGGYSEAHFERELSILEKKGVAEKKDHKK